MMSIWITPIVVCLCLRASPCNGDLDGGAPMEIVGDHQRVGESDQPANSQFQTASSSALGCQASLLPTVRNGYVIQLSEIEVSVYCDVGYELPPDQRQDTLECLNGTWGLAEKDLLCQLECNGDGPCGPPSTFCHPDLYENFTISFGTVTSCPSGYTVRSPASPMQCVDMAWTPQDDCVPQCEGDCGGYGTCVAPKTCLCDNKKVKETCSQTDQGDLISLMGTRCGALKESATMNQTTNEINLQCPASYRFVEGISGESATIVCSQGYWTTVGTEAGLNEMDCEPSCDMDCLNSGHCDQSGKCVCTSGFFGAACELRRCEPLPVFPNGVVSASTDRSSATIECHPGFNLPGSFATRLRVLCDDAQWVLPPQLRGGCVSTPTVPCGDLELPSFVALEDSSPTALRMQCHPHSEILGPSLRALCVDGDWVEEEVGVLNLRVLTLDQWSELCEPTDACPRNPKFLRHMNFTVAENFGATGSGVSLGLLTCSSGYAFPTGETSLHVTCSFNTNFKWRMPGVMTSQRLTKEYAPSGPDSGLHAHIPPCKPVCSPPCLNGATCQAPGHCICTSWFRGPQCNEPCEDEPIGCRAPPPVQGNADIYYNGSLAVVECHAGYELHTGLSHYHLHCEQERWLPANLHGGLLREEFPTCLPVCQFPCLNGGHCQSPNSCWCSPQFRGTYCQVPKQHKCPNDPDPVPNSLIHVTEAGRVLRCAAGYSLHWGLTEAKVWCREGQWVFPRVLYGDQKQDEFGGPQAVEMKTMIDGDSSFAPCSPVCDPPCFNRGVCVAPGQCRCPPPFVGARCDTLDPSLCWGTPPAIQNASIMYSPMSGSLRCEEGYSLLSGVQSVLLSCRAGVWQAVPDTPTAMVVNEKMAASSSWLEGCHPTCLRPCLNGGFCVAPDTCYCAKGFVGKICETLAPKTCLSLVRAKVHADVIISSATSSTSLHCHEGYILPRRLARVNLNCRDGVWVAEVGDKLLPADELDCQPLCPRGCRNGGTCRAPGQCECPQGYAGPDCSVRTCDVPPKLVANTIWQYDPQSQFLDVQCREGYRLQTGNLTTALYCDDGTWRAAGGEEKVECLPSCHPPCVNGGRCVSPSTCVCPDGFSGTTCNKRYSLTVEGTRCVFPFYHRGRLLHACTADYNYTFSTAPIKDTSVITPFHLPSSCGEGELSGDVLPCDVPWCPTAVDSNRRPVQWGICAGIVGNSAAQLTEGGETCIFPFSYEGEKYLQCTKAGGRPSEWCATEVDERAGATRWDFCQQDYGLESVTITYQGTECHFPFRYDGQWYDECLSRFSYAGSWCATDVTPAGDLLTKGNCIVHWGHYQDYLTQAQMVCASPYLIEGVTQWGCQGQDPWCPVKLTQELAVDQWSFCDPHSEWPGESASLPSASERPEVRVFTVAGERCLPGGMVGVEGCVGDGALGGVPWCPIIRDGLGVITRKGVCLPDWHLSFVPPWLKSYVNSGPKEPLVRHTTQGVLCVLPFRYRGRTYLDCAPHLHQSSGESSPRLWCAVTVKLDLEVETWDHCKENIYSVHYSGPKVLSVVQNIITRQQQLCVFPFHHDGAVYYSCVSDNSTVNSHGWCATSVTANGGVGRRGDCPLLATQLTDPAKVIQQCKDEGDSLIFPAGPSMGRLPSQSTGTDPHGSRCVVPFVYRNVTYWDCTEGEAGEDVSPWCAVEVDDRRNVVKKERCLPGWYLKPTDLIKEVAWERDWILDMQGAVLRVGNLHGALDADWQRVETSSGKVCVFPFLIPGSSVPQHHCVCPLTGCGGTGPVCATKVDAGGNMLESEPCRRLLMRKEDFFDQLMSH